MGTKHHLLALLTLSTTALMAACGDDTTDPNDAVEADTRDVDMTARPDVQRESDGEQADAADTDGQDTASPDTIEDVSDTGPGTPDADAIIDTDLPDTDIPDSASEDASGDSSIDLDTGADADSASDVADDVTPSLPNFILTELMVASCEAEAGAAQWAELRNNGGRAATLDGLILSDGTGGVHRMTGFPLVEPGELVIIGASSDPDNNGGVDVDYVWSGLDFAAESGTFVIATDGATVFELRYDFSGVDACSSLSLSSDSLTPAAAADFDNYCPSTSLYNASDKGTPGAANPVCAVPDREVDWCRLQFPIDLALLPGEEQTAYVRVFNDGTTNITTGTDADPELIIDLGTGPDDVFPSDGRWTWTPASANAGWNDATEPGNDEYQATLTAPGSAGVYDFAFRASRDGGLTWLYCDRAAGPGADGAENGYQPSNAGTLTVRDLCAEADCPAGEQVSCDGNTRVRTISDGTCSVVDGAAVCSQSVESIDVCDEATPCTAAGDAAFCLGEQIVQGSCTELADCPADLAPICDGSASVAATLQRCDLGACVYDTGRTNCSDSGRTCSDGLCVTPSPPVGYCVVQFPKDFDVVIDGAATVYGRVYIERLTDRTTGNDTDALVITRIGAGAVGTLPGSDASWRWVDAAPNSGYTATDEPNNDEYQADLTAVVIEASVGDVRDVAFSVSTNGGESWFYCDRNGGGFRPYDPGQAARLTVIAAP